MVDQLNLWPFPPSWDVRFSERISFETEVFASRNGTEQREAIRAKPRSEYRFTSKLSRGGLEAAVRRVAERQGRLTYVAHPRGLATLSGGSAAQSTSIALSSVPAWASAGRFAALARQASRQHELVEIASVSGSTLTLVDGLLAPAHTGDRLHRAVLGQAAGASAINTETSRVATAAVTFRADPIDAALDSYGAAPATYNGAEIFVLSPNASERGRHTFEQERETIDFGRGAIDTLFPIDFTRRQTRHAFVLRTSAQVDAVLGLFHRCRGRQRGFYMPTWLSELDGFSFVNATTIKVAGREAYDAYAASTVYRHVTFRAGAAFVTRSIVSWSINVDGDTQIVLSSAPNVAAAAVSWAGFLTYQRFNSDEITVDWVTDSVARVTVSTVTLEDGK